MQRIFSLRQKSTKVLREQHFSTKILSPQKPSLTKHFLSHSQSSNQSFSHLASGFFSNQKTVNHFVKFPLFKGFSQGFAYSSLGFSKNQIFRRSNSSFQDLSRGWQSWLRKQSPDNVALGLILTNVTVFILWRIADRQFMRNNFMISLDNIKSGRVHTLITSAFSQIDVGHLISNMIGLYFFGTNIGRNFGSVFLLKLYLTGALAGSVFFLAHKGFLALSSKSDGGWGMNPSRVPGLGASGAVNAIMLLDIFLNPKATLYLEFIIPVPAILLGIFIIGKDMLRILEGNSEVSGSAHLGGAVVAALAWARIRKRLF